MSCGALDQGAPVPLFPPLRGPPELGSAPGCDRSVRHLTMRGAHHCCPALGHHPFRSHPSRLAEAATTTQTRAAPQRLDAALWEEAGLVLRSFQPLGARE